MQLPVRIRTGYKNRTIPNPNRVPFGTYEDPNDKYQGLVEGYDFRHQNSNYLKLKKALKKFGVSFTKVTGMTSKGDTGRNHRFIVLTDNKAILWYKYVGYAAQSGQNHLYLHGRRVKVSCFLNAETEVQRALVTNVIPAKLATKVEYLDESGTLWN